MTKKSSHHEDTRAVKRQKVESSDEEEEMHLSKRVAPSIDTSGLYLETIDRNRLDFDFEKVCSVSLSNVNVYACLVCGKYFQGRGTKSHAYFHSIHEDHHVFLNLDTLKCYLLPEGNEVVDDSLDDIKYVVKPTFTAEQVAKVDKEPSQGWDLQNKSYVPGFIGLNNIKANDYINVIVQALAHVHPLRDQLLLATHPFASELANRFALLVRKMWNPRAFKGHVSPHELLQEISNASARKFKATQQGDASEFLMWFLNALHAGMGGDRKPGSSIIHRIFQGKLRIETQEFAKGSGTHAFQGEKAFQTNISPFLLLTLDLPPAPLFQDAVEKNIIPQVAMSTLLQKYDGVNGLEVGNTLKRFRILQLPSYLIIHIKRFTKNNFTLEKNPTIVNFPLTGLDLAAFCEGVTGETRYDLIANIIHEGSAENGKLKVHLCRGEDWYQIQDIIIEDIVPQMIVLSESFIQIWKKR